MGFEVLAFWGEFSVLDVVECSLIGIDVADSGAAFDAHVADGHAFFHAHRVEYVAAKFVGITDAAFDAEVMDDAEDNVFCIDAFLEFSCDGDAADFESGERECLCF